MCLSDDTPEKNSGNEIHNIRRKQRILFFTTTTTVNEKDPTRLGPDRRPLNARSEYLETAGVGSVKRVRFSVPKAVSMEKETRPSVSLVDTATGLFAF